MSPLGNINGLDDLSTISDDDLKSALTEATKTRTGLTPRDYQLDAAISLGRRRDTIMHAGTGRGKSLIMVMLCFLIPTLISVMVSPLNALEESQVSAIFSISLSTF